MSFSYIFGNPSTALVNLGALVTLTLGMLAVLRPGLIQSFVNIRAVGREGLSEIKATYGGFFIALGLYALLSQAASAFIMLGVGWLGAALVRLLTVLQGAWSMKNLGAVLFEGLIGGFCLARFI